jgi:hypothetical protein
MEYFTCAPGAVEFTDEFEQWWKGLEESEQIKIAAAVRLLEEYGPDLPYPNDLGVAGSRHSHMREKRTAILLLGGDKTGGDRWYETNIPIADRLYDRHLEELKKENPENG